MDELDGRQKMNIFLIVACAAMASVVSLTGATVTLYAKGVIDHAWIGAYPFVDAGDRFQLVVTYSDIWDDTNPDSDIGVYILDNLSISLEIVGKGVAFTTLGGSINVSLTPDNFPSISILSTLSDGNWLFFLFRDDDRSSIGDDSLPTSFGAIGEYDAVGFSVLANPAMWPSTSNPIDGTVSGLAIPEPTTFCFVSLAALAFGTHRSRQQKPNRVEVTGLRQSPLPHHRTCGFDSVPPSMQSGFAGFSALLQRPWHRIWWLLSD